MKVIISRTREVDQEEFTSRKVGGEVISRMVNPTEKEYFTAIPHKNRQGENGFKENFINFE